MGRKWQWGLLAIGLVACREATDAQPTAERVDSAGVEVVTSPGVDRVLPERLEMVERIAGGEGDTLFQSDWKAVSVRGSADGQLWIGDLSFGSGGLYRVDRPSGKLVPVGRRGGGPGEYRFPGMIAVAPSGEAAVVDFGKQALVRFKPDGTPLPELRWEALGEGMPGRLAFVQGGMVVQMTVREDSGVVQRLVLAASDTSELIRLEAAPPRMVMYESCGVGFAQSPLFSPGLAWAARDAEVAWAAGPGYEVDVWREGRIVRRIRRHLAPRAATRALARQEIGEGQQIGFDDRPTCTIDPDEVLEKRGFTPTIPAIERIALTPDGAIWVQRKTIPGETPLLDILDSTGAYLGTFAGEFPWPQAWLPGGEFVAVMPDSLGLPVVGKYRVLK